MRILSLVFIILSVLSCRDEVSLVPKPKQLVPEDTMVMLLKDMTVIESHIQMRYGQASVYKELMEKSGKEILDKYSVSEKRYESSLEYYGSRQLEMQAIYSRVIDSLNLMSGKISASPEKDKDKLPENSILKIQLKDMPKN